MAVCSLQVQQVSQQYIHAVWAAGLDVAVASGHSAAAEPHITVQLPSTMAACTLSRLGSQLMLQPRLTLDSAMMKPQGAPSQIHMTTTNAVCGLRAAALSMLLRYKDGS